MSSSSSNADALALGIHGPLGPWLEFNRRGAFETPGGLAMVAPFPPADRMSITTGLTDPRDFASHGYDVLKALSEASPRAIDQFESILDFGVGAGRLARMFKGYRGRYTGCDVDAENIRWLSRGLTYVDARHTLPRQALPFPVSDFDLIVSISVFSHMNERDQDFYLAELARVARPQATLMLTVHGERALRRAETEPGIFKMLSIPTASVPAIGSASVETTRTTTALVPGSPTSSKMAVSPAIQVVNGSPAVGTSTKPPIVAVVSFALQPTSNL